MSYDPDEYVVAGRQVAAGWVVCLVIIGVALGLTTKHELVGHDPLSGAHIPRFVYCCTRLDQSLFAVAGARRDVASTTIGDCS